MTGSRLFEARNALWIVAVVSVLVAGAVVAGALSRSGDRATIEDASGDVFGTARDEVEEAIDLRSVTIARKGDRYAVDVRMHGSIDRELLDPPATVELRILGKGKSYTLTATLGEDRARAVVRGAPGEPPFVVEAPAIKGSTVHVDVPEKAIAGLGGSFTWGVTTASSGSSDSAPSDFSARFPN